MVAWLVARALADPTPPPAAFAAEGRVEAPTWSADGRSLAFVVRGDTSPSLHVAEVGGGKVLAPRLVTGPGGSRWVDLEPTGFLPDGRLLFSARASRAEHPDLWVVPAGGGAATGFLTASDAPTAVTDPALSRDGRTLVLVGQQGGWWDLLAKDLDGELRRLTLSSAPEAHPFVDAVGQRIVFERHAPDRGQDLFEIDLAGGLERTVTSARGADVRPAVGARDTVVWFHEDDGWELRAGDRVIAEGVRLPTSGPPAISPDGEWVAFTHNDRDRASSVRLVDVAGTRAVDLPTPFTGCADPALALHEGRLTLAYTALDADDRRVLLVTDVSGPVQRPVPYLGSAPFRQEVADVADVADAEGDGGDDLGGAAEATPEGAAEGEGAADTEASPSKTSGTPGTAPGRQSASRDPTRRGRRGGEGSEPDDGSDRGDGGRWSGGAAGAVVGFGSVVALVGLVAALMVVETFRRTSR